MASPVSNLRTGASFDGATYVHEFDYNRLTGQIRRTYDAMKDGRWRTLAEIERLTGDPQASISARLRDLRKPKFGGLTVEHERKPSSNPRRGIWRYRLVLPDQGELF